MIRAGALRYSVKSMPGTISIDLSARRLWRLLLAALAIVSLAGLAAELAYYLGHSDSELVPAFSLSYEHNVPTWYASSLLLTCAALLAVIATARRQGGQPDAGYWLGLSAIFGYISLDEVVSIHERASAWFDTSGMLYFGWVIPGAIAVVIIGALYVPFLRRLHPITRWRFMVAGAIFITGGLIMELPLGYWTEHAGDQNLIYALIDWLEESLELLGTSVFCAALVAQLGMRSPDDAPNDALHLVFSNRPDEAVVPKVHD